MARKTGILNARKVETLTKIGSHADGGNLYLSISPNGGRRWVFFYRLNNKRKEMGLGSAAKGHVGLGEARKAATEARAIIAAGRPIDAKTALKRANQGHSHLENSPMTILPAMLQVPEPKHIAQWEMSLKNYCHLSGHPFQ